MVHQYGDTEERTRGEREAEDYSGRVQQGMVEERRGREMNEYVANRNEPVKIRHCGCNLRPATICLRERAGKERGPEDS